LMLFFKDNIKRSQPSAAPTGRVSDLSAHLTGIDAAVLCQAG
jgi:hypothetical protein